MRKANIREYRIWKAMKSRCYSPCLATHGTYQIKGIQVCERWRHNFDNFIEDMGYAPSDKHSIDRTDNDGNYEPDNCRWATMKEQSKNRGSFNKVFIYNGEAKVLKDWARFFNIKYSTLHARIYRKNMPFEDAVKLNNRYQNFMYDGQLSSLKDIVGKYSVVPYQTVADRLHKRWTLEKALKTELRINRYK